MEEGWRIKADDFIMSCATQIADSQTQTDLYDLIALAYNDPRPFYQSFVPRDQGPSPYNFEHT